MALRTWLAVYSVIIICICVSAAVSATSDVKFHASPRLRHRVRRAASSGNRLTYGERLDFLKAHNNFRANVNPSSANMKFMTWHKELADMAQEWADTCQFKHGQPERDPPPFPGIGQNIYASTASGVNGTAATTSWYNEVADYTLSSNSCADNKVCGHYTQVVWANSDSLGCAIAECPQLGGTTMTNAIYIVCNYGPAGNVVGQNPYIRGAPCSSCPTGMECYANECVNNPKCGSKTCGNGEVYDAYCECYCPEGDNCTGDDNGTEQRRIQALSLYLIAFISVVIL